MRAPDASSEVADWVTLAPLTRSTINTTSVTKPATLSRPINVIETGRSHRARRTECVGSAAINAASRPISIGGDEPRRSERLTVGFQHAQCDGDSDERRQDQRDRPARLDVDRGDALRGIRSRSLILFDVSDHAATVLRPTSRVTRYRLPAVAHGRDAEASTAG